MADSKISALAAVTTVGDTDEYVAAVSGATKKITGANLKLAMGMAKIGGATLGAPAANIDITSIPATYSQLQLWTIGQTSDAATQTMRLTFNGDTSSIYDYETGDIRAAGSTNSSETFAAAFIAVGALPASTATGMVNMEIINVPFYASTTFHKHLVAQGGLQLTTSSGGVIWRGHFGRWRSTSAISRITLTPAAGNFVTGTSWSLYGIA